MKGLFRLGTHYYCVNFVGKLQQNEVGKNVTLVIEVTVGCMSVCLCKTKDCVIKAGKYCILYFLSQRLTLNMLTEKPCINEICLKLSNPGFSYVHHPFQSRSSG